MSGQMSRYTGAFSRIMLSSATGTRGNFHDAGSDGVNERKIGTTDGNKRAFGIT